ncbi:glycosyltransferase [Robertmurraya beringensis]|uniref:Glycosyltransferase n=1 Tax=Robertmurraya beringensis TaxID=641660 RepID=A0ABV6KS15_9BACI
MKKKILFMLISMNIGGTEKAFLNMLSDMSANKYDITLVLLEKSGGFLQSIPKHVKIVTFKDYIKIKASIENPLHSIARELFLQKKLRKAFIYLIFYINFKIFKENTLLFKYILKDIETQKEIYDIAIAYAGPMDFISYFILNKVRAKRKMQWIHFDVTKIGFNKYFAHRHYQKYDRIFVVSKEARERLVKVLPKLDNKIKVFKNNVSKDLIVNMANGGEGFIDKFNGLRILTVGRLSSEKGQDLAIRVMARLKNEGINVKWYCIGEGNARHNWEGLIRKNNLQDDFILLGAKVNPYSFMKECNIYVQPSRHEGYCITLAEAKCFNIPIIATNFTGAKEQISSYDKGTIVEFNEQQLYEAIVKLM